MDRVRRTAVDAYAHQDLPFEKLVEALKPAARHEPEPLVPGELPGAGPASAALDLPGARATPVEIDLGLSRFDMAMELQASPEGIDGYVEYNDELFTPETAARWAGELRGAAAPSRRATRRAPLGSASDAARSRVHEEPDVSRLDVVHGST